MSASRGRGEGRLARVRAVLVNGRDVGLLWIECGLDGPATG